MAYKGEEAEVTVCEAGQAPSSPSHYCWVTPLPGPAREWRLRTASNGLFLTQQAFFGPLFWVNLIRDLSWCAFRRANGLTNPALKSKHWILFI